MRTHKRSASPPTPRPEPWIPWSKRSCWAGFHAACSLGGAERAVEGSAAARPELRPNSNLHPSAAAALSRCSKAHWGQHARRWQWRLREVGCPWA